MEKGLVEFHYRGYSFEGISEGGIRTSIICANLDLMFDVGNQPVHYTHIGNLLLTHAHLDHSAGLPYYISQRSLRNLKPPKIYVPEEIYFELDSIIKLYQKIEDFNYNYNLISAKKGELYELSQNFFLRPLKTLHRIPSQGYTIYEKSRKLKPEFLGLKSEEIIRRKQSGEILTEEKFVPLISFSGDTQIEYVLENEDVQKSKILFLECTYLDDKRDVQRARKWGHLHLDEIVANSKYFQNEKLVLIHFSKRYSSKEIFSLIRSKLPSDLLERTYCFI